MTEPAAAIIVGVGPGLGASLARRFARAGMAIAVAARRPEKLAGLVEEIGATGVAARAYGCDATDDAQVAALFAAAAGDLGHPDLVVFNASGRVRKSILDIETAEFVQAWRGACLGGFIVGREAARMMVPHRRGTIIFTGATASVKAYASSAGFAVGKFGLRALAQSMARELGPRGIHVAHVVVDGGIRADTYREDPAKGEDYLLDPDAIAETYHHLYTQDRSSWAQEIDLRPWVEKF